MGAQPSTFPVSTASFTSNTFNFDPLVAGETISQGAEVAGGHGLLTRGTVLFGPVIGTPITGSSQLTPVSGVGAARCILAADVDTTSGEIMALVYTQGKFLDTAMTFTAQGAAADVAQLWQFGIYVLTVEQRLGLLVPMIGLPITGGPLPQAAESSSELEAKAKELADRAKALETQSKQAEAESKALEWQAKDVAAKEREAEAKQREAYIRTNPRDVPYEPAHFEGGKAEHHPHAEPVKEHQKPPIPNPPPKR